MEMAWSPGWKLRIARPSDRQQGQVGHKQNGDNHGSCPAAAAAAATTTAATATATATATASSDLTRRTDDPRCHERRILSGSLWGGHLQPPNRGTTWCCRYAASSVLELLKPW